MPSAFFDPPSLPPAEGGGAALRPTGWLVEDPRNRGWHERWGGILVALLAHLALAGMLANQIVRVEVLPKPAPITITFDPPPPQTPPPPAEPPPATPPPQLPAAVAVPAQPAEPQPTNEPAPMEFASVAATTSDPAAIESDEKSVPPPMEQTAELEARREQALPREEAKDEPPPQAPEPTAPESSVPPIQTVDSGVPLTGAQLEAEIRKERDTMTRQSIQQSDQINRLRTEVSKAVAESKGRRFFVDTDGGKSGVVRSFDISGFPETIVNAVFSRFGIRVERRLAGAEERTGRGPSQSFLNAAITDDGVYRNVRAGGVQDVFVLPSKAVAYMAKLETDEMNARNLDPGTTRVREVRFGIVKRKDGTWDLGITNFRWERVE